MKAVLVALILIGGALALSGPPTPKPIEVAPIVQGPSQAAYDALKQELQTVRAELFEVKKAQAAATTAPAATVPPTTARGGTVVQPTSYYQRRPVYGRFGRFQGYETVLVQPQQMQSVGNCANGNCSTGFFGRRR